MGGKNMMGPDEIYSDKKEEKKSVYYIAHVYTHSTHLLFWRPQPVRKLLDCYTLIIISTRVLCWRNMAMMLVQTHAILFFLLWGINKMFVIFKCVFHCCCWFFFETWFYLDLLYSIGSFHAKSSWIIGNTRSIYVDKNIYKGFYPIQPMLLTFDKRQIRLN